MTKKEFANYLYKNSDNLNFLIINEYLFQNYSYLTTEDEKWLGLISICHDFGIKIFKGNLQNDGLYDAYLECSNNERYIVYNNKLSLEQERHLTYYLLFEFLKHYRDLVDGGESATYIKLTERGIITIDEQKKNKSKIIEFPKKY